MNCKKCGAQIRREDRRADGRCVCPACGAVWHVRLKPVTAEAGVPNSAEGLSTQPDSGNVSTGRHRSASMNAVQSDSYGAGSTVHHNNNAGSSTAHRASNVTGVRAASADSNISGEAGYAQTYSRKAARRAKAQSAARTDDSGASVESAGAVQADAPASKQHGSSQVEDTQIPKRDAGKQNTKRSSRHRKKQSKFQRLMRRINWKNVGLAAGCVAVLLVALVLVIPKGGDGTQDTADALLASASAAPTLTPAPTVEPTPTPVPTASVHFRAVGDVMSHKLQLRNAYREDGSFDYAPQFEYVKDALSKADYTIANLELSIATDDNYSSYPFFRAPEAILTALKDSGVDFLTMSNNHILDGFFDGLTHTVDKVEEYGFDHVGAYRTAQEAQQPVVLDINGIRFGFLAYTEHVNENDKRIDAEQARFCVKKLGDADFNADVQELRELGAEVVICLPHWGEEERRSVTASCKNYAQEMVDAGVDIILGSHPHVVLPINCGELEVNGEKKDVLIAWSMGNFISYMATRYMDSGIIVDFTVERDETGKIHISNPGYVPVYVWGHTDVFHLLCSGDFYSQRPEGMSDDDYSRMKQSVKEITDMIGQDGIELLTN